MILNSLLFFKNIRIISHYLNYKPKHIILLRNQLSPINLLYRLYSKSADQNEPTEIHYPPSRIRNFSIIAHVDHGKSTLADRLLEITGAIEPNSGYQVLDTLQVERERGITVKAQSVSLDYEYKGENYLLNLIDTPGHVDFSTEVSRSLIASQGVILLIDANKGVQAQTVANFYLAFEKDLVLIPVLNKVDLPRADSDLVITQLNTLFDIDPNTVLKISAKFGTGVSDLLDAIVERIPPPTENLELPLIAQVFDSWFDKYRGAFALATIKQGKILVGDELQSALTNQTFFVKSLALLRPSEQPVSILSSGQVGCIVCGIRDPKGVKVGDTWFLRKHPVEITSDLFKTNRPAVYTGLYPLDQSKHPSLRSAIEKLVLNDPSVEIAVDNSAALGHGWRLGFLGLLHLEVFSQRLEQEYGALCVLTPPSVTYQVKIKGEKNIKLNGGKDLLYISNPAHYPDVSIIDETAEPMTLVTIISPMTYYGEIVSLCHEHRGIHIDSSSIDQERMMFKFEIPLNEIIFDFHDKLKSISSGYASLDYENIGFKTSILNKLCISLNGKEVEELNVIVHSSRAEKIARKTVLKLRDTIPRQMVQIPIQAKIGGKIIARETIKAYRKDVTAKLYGGDVTRRMKLLRQQSEGKKKMQSIANIQVPRETYIKVFKR